MLLVLCLFDCFKETASDQSFPYSPAFERSKRSARRWSWLRFCFLPPRLQARKTHFETAKSFCQFASLSWASTHSRRIPDINWDHLALKLIATKRQVGTYELNIVNTNGNWLLSDFIERSTRSKNELFNWLESLESQEINRLSILFVS